MVFDLLALITCLVSIRITIKQHERVDDGLQIISYERIELLFVFASVVLSMLGALLIFKEITMRYVFEVAV